MTENKKAKTEKAKTEKGAKPKITAEKGEKKAVEAATKEDNGKSDKKKGIKSENKGAIKKKKTTKLQEEKPKVKRKKSSEEKKIAKIKDAIKNKKLPTFRGRFGKRWMRKRSKAKWNKWRKTRGIDIKRNSEDGRIPDSGFRTKRTIRYLHPSGLKEKLVMNLPELKAVTENSAVRIAGTIGKRKRKIIIEEAGKMKLKVLNP